MKLEHIPGTDTEALTNVARNSMTDHSVQEKGQHLKTWKFL